jgi:phosphopentomutase
MARALLLVIDSLGVGAMADVAETRPADLGANTLARVLEANPQLRLPALETMGLGRVLNHPRLNPDKARGAWGTNRLQHQGADSYMGHQELMGSNPLAPQLISFAQVSAQVKAALEARGHEVKVPDPWGGWLLVDDLVVVADNIETDYGQIYNVTGPLDQIEFAGIERIGEIVRAATQVSRVIALGGEGVSRDQILASIRTREDGLTGVDSPASGVYKRGYRSRHMGYGIDPGRQLPAAVLAAGRPVGLVGKMQDIIHCPRAQRVPAVATDLVLREFGRLARELEAGLVAATIQETDLAGHAQDARQYGALLAMTDAWLAEFLPTLRPGDLLVVTGDHGNDPGIGHPQHTREKTPLLVYGPGLKVVDLGERATLSDIAATLARHLGAAAPENGCSFYEKLD